MVNTLQTTQNLDISLFFFFFAEEDKEMYQEYYNARA